MDAYMFYMIGERIRMGTSMGLSTGRPNQGHGRARTTGTLSGWGDRPAYVHGQRADSG